MDLEFVHGDMPDKQRFEAWPDRNGGYTAEYSPAYMRSKEDSLWLEVKATVNEPFGYKYHFSFQGGLNSEITPLGHRMTIDRLDLVTHP